MSDKTARRSRLQELLAAMNVWYGPEDRGSGYFAGHCTVIVDFKDSSVLFQQSLEQAKAAGVPIKTFDIERKDDHAR